MLEHVVSLSDKAVQATQDTGTWLDKLALGGGVMVLGLAVVFLGLISLIIITLVYPKISRALIAKSSERKEKAAERKKDRAKNISAAKSVEKKTAPATVPAIQAEVESNDALIAVITAAVAASMGKSANGVVIKSIERTGQNVPAWGARGRIEQVLNRF